MISTQVAQSHRINAALMSNMANRPAANDTPPTPASAKSASLSARWASEYERPRFIDDADDSLADAQSLLSL